MTKKPLFFNHNLEVLRLRDYGLSWPVFWEETITNGYRFFQESRKSTSMAYEDFLPMMDQKGYTVQVAEPSGCGISLVLSAHKHVVAIRLPSISKTSPDPGAPSPEDPEDEDEFDRDRTASWKVGANSLGAATLVSNEIFDLLPDYEIKDPGVLPVSFWSLGEHGSVRVVRELGAPSWDSIAQNYSKVTRDAFSQLARLRPPFTGGQLILLHGSPGTGKTYAIRALSREWKTWCGCSYIIDPDMFLRRANYLMEVLVHRPRVSGRKQWHLILIEDGDEFLTMDAKERSGQALSRLLNITEGFIGQGLNVLLLITTNEPIQRLHPAVSRPGRCLADLEFGLLTAQESGAWLSSRKVKCAVSPGGHTLAELYQMTKDNRIVARGTKVTAGFVR